MAKSKPIPKAEPKKFVPTTGIFKHVTRSKKRRWEAHKAQHTAKKTVEKHLQASPKRKSKQTPNHSLAIAFASMALKVISSDCLADTRYSKLLSRAPAATLQTRSTVLSNPAFNLFKSGLQAPTVISRENYRP